MRRYNPGEIEPKWQALWEEKKVNEVTIDPSKRKTYASGMFPYPSGAGMHTGHAFSYTIVDAIARFYRQQGHDVLNPMGWDTFGLPAENYAIKTGTSPQVATDTNTTNFKRQFKRMGVSIDWSRELNTSDPEYYRWTQWIFTKFSERGLAYQKESLQWWCPVDKTVLANEQVESGNCWRCGTPVEKKSMKQWFFKITDYADSLLEEIPSLDWPQKIKTAQTNWIGKSVGAEIQFSVADTDSTITVFSTRPDTLFGATFIVLAPEHLFAKELAVGDFKDAAIDYIKESVKKSEIDRTNDTKEKSGIFTGSYALHPITGAKVPIWIADYVLGGYGTGAVMAVPAHDERDFAFASKFELPIIDVIAADPEFGDASLTKEADAPKVYAGEGVLINSGDFDGVATSEARERIITWLESESKGAAKTTYKMRDWLISRQRYWGAPIPIIHCETHGAVPVPDDQLPVLLPEIEDYAPKGDGKSALAHAEDWVNTTCPTCGEPALRETDTMDGYACSSWYLLRYTDPKNAEMAWSPEAANYWSPVDYYVGGDHAVAHLLYVRFWNHVFHDMGLVGFKEPVKKLVYHGYINAEDGTKMSKSKGNVIDPLDIIDQGYGADALRTYVLFMGPVELDSSWDPRGVGGIYRFLNRAWTLVQEYEASEKNVEKNDIAVRILQHRTIRKVTSDYRDLGFNTAIASLMEYVNELYKFKVDGFSDAVWGEALRALVQMLAPVAPHMSDELWSQLGGQGFVQQAQWPAWDEALTVDATITVAVQVNGKVRGEVTIAKDADAESVRELALAHENVVKFVTGEPKKVIYVPGRLVSIVV